MIGVSCVIVLIVGVRCCVCSPQFQQQLAHFSAALESGQLDLAQFGLQGQGFSVVDFLQAIQAAVDKEQRERQQQQQPPNP